ncbi:MAG: L,D-transpeptidase family protein [Chloroflexota bacterium]|nr:L,D-transpeptidase family protein [Chloroflexota bacterium]
MRYALVLAFILIGAVVGGLAYREFTAGPPVVLPPPTRLQASTAGAPLVPGGWSNSSTIDLKVLDPAVAAGADVEVRPEGHAFQGTATITAAAPGQIAAACKTCGSGAEVAHVHLADGSYHWQARLHNGTGVSPWMVYHGVIRVDTRPPTIANLASPTDPNSGQTYHQSTLHFTWQGNDAGSGVDGYSYRLDTDPRAEARAELRTRTPDITLTGLNTGTYYFHARALDHAGNWGQTSTFPVHIDVTPPGLANVRFNAFQFDPQFNPLKVSFHVTRAAKEVRVGVYRQGSGTLVRLYTLHHLFPGQNTTVSWNGKGNQGNFVGTGTYEVYIRAIDPYGHASVTGWRDFVLDYKRIVVSLSQQRMWAYDGHSLFVTSLVTTGNPALPTPTGTYTILAKFHPFTFHSPWPKSSPYYYAPSLTEWAMLFQAGGYFIHDAPWRSNFGPGSNTQVGAPGQNYTGSHGCINVPADVAQRLYAWAPVGTVVQVNQ